MGNSTPEFITTTKAGKTEEAMDMQVARHSCGERNSHRNKQKVHSLEQGKVETDMKGSHVRT
jgi:hypothetical protein